MIRVAVMAVPVLLVADLHRRYLRGVEMDTYDDDLAEALRNEVDPAELARMHAALQAGIVHLQAAIPYFESMGHETDTTDLQEFLDEAVNAEKIIGGVRSE